MLCGLDDGNDDDDDDDGDGYTNDESHLRWADDQKRHRLFAKCDYFHVFPPVVNHAKKGRTLM